jgi:hypothetical protein
LQRPRAQGCDSKSVTRRKNLSGETSSLARRGLVEALNMLLFYLTSKDVRV